MNNYRIVKHWGGEDWTYTIKDVYTGKPTDPNGRSIYPIVKHEPHGLLAASSVEDMKRVLHAMMQACDKPALELVETRTILREEQS